jgi:hypothetical protein
MPYNNEYNRSLSRDIDFLNRSYITHCDSTGQGTINYRTQMSGGYCGAGKGSKVFHSGDSESEEEECHHRRNKVGKGGAILGFQAGTILGGPKDEANLPTRKQITSFSSLGAPLGLSNAVLRDADNDAQPPERPAPPPVEGAKVGGAILGFKGMHIPSTSEVGRFSKLTTAVRPPIGTMYRAGKKVSVRDLGDFDDYQSDSDYSSSSDEEAERRGRLLLEVDVVKTGGSSHKIKGMDALDAAKKKMDEVFADRKKEGNPSGNGINKHHKRHRAHSESDEEHQEGGFAAALAKGAQLGLKVGARVARTAAKVGAKAARAAAKAAKTAAQQATKRAKDLAKNVAKRAKSMKDKAARALKAKNAKLTKGPKPKAKKGKLMKNLDRLGNLSSAVTSVAQSMTRNKDANGNPIEGETGYEEGEDEEEPEEEEEEIEDQEDEAVHDAEDEVKAKQAKERENKNKANLAKGETKSKEELEKLKKDVAEAKEGNTADAEGPKWLKDKKQIEQENKKQVGQVKGFAMYSKKPVQDWNEFYQDEFGDFEGATMSEIISDLKDQGFEPEDIQQLISQSQGAIKAKESKGISSTLSSAKIDARTDVGNVNKNTSCLDAYNNVADSNPTAPKEARPVRKNDTYFGGYYKTSLKSTRQVQQGMKEEAQMHSSSMSGMGKPKRGRKPKAQMKSSSMSGMGAADLVRQRREKVASEAKKTAAVKNDPIVKQAEEFKKTQEARTEGKPAQEAEDSKKRQEAITQGNPAKEAVSEPISGKGRPRKVRNDKGVKKPNARAVIVKKVMQEKGISMIEASKYVKAKGLY